MPSAEENRRLLELPVGRERHPERVGLDGVRNLMKGHGPRSFADLLAEARLEKRNKSFSDELQAIDLIGAAGPYLRDPQHLQHGTGT
jgi:hypothetical protein